MVNRMVDGAAGILALAAGVARHVAWYVSYQVDGTARAERRPDEPEDEST